MEREDKKSIPQLTSLSIKDFKQRVVLPTNLSAGAGGGLGGDLFLIKELVTVALVLADARSNTQAAVALQCVINRLHSLPSTPAPTSSPFCLTPGCLHPKWHGNLSFLVSIQRSK